MRVAVTGSTGLIGSALVAHLRSEGHSVSRLVRNNAQSQAERLIAWNPARGAIDAAALEAHDAIVHLAGEPIFGLWTEKRKQHIRDSRVRGTALLARTVAGLSKPPRVFVSASAMGYYGDRGATPLDETSGPGSGFLAEVAVAWEQAAQAASATSRVVNPRFGLVLSRRGGALPIMLPIFRAGVGGRLGSGEQVWSWITLTDVVRAITHAILTASLTGPLNLAAPHPVTNAEFTRTLGHLLGRPTFVAAPRFALRLFMRQLADEMLLASTHMVPRKLLDSGYVFADAQLEPALRVLAAKA